MIALVDNFSHAALLPFGLRCAGHDHPSTMVFLVIVFTPLTILTDSWVDMLVLVFVEEDSLGLAASASTSPAFANVSPSIKPFSWICSFNLSSICLSVGERLDESPSAGSRCCRPARREIGRCQGLREEECRTRGATRRQARTRRSSARASRGSLWRGSPPACTSSSP